MHIEFIISDTLNKGTWDKNHYFASFWSFRPFLIIGRVKYEFRGFMFSKLVKSSTYRSNLKLHCSILLHYLSVHVSSDTANKAKVGTNFTTSSIRGIFKSRIR